MGIAAYNRGTAVVSRQIDEAMPDHNSAVVDSINALPRGKCRLFSPTVVRVVPYSGRWMLMNRRDRGFASFGYEYKTLRALFAIWNCYVTSYGRDEHSFYYEVASV